MPTRPIVVLALAAAALLAAASPADAQSCGGCAGPAVTSSPGAERPWPAAGALRLRVFDEYEVKDRSYRGTDRVVNDFAEDLYVNRLGATFRLGLPDDWAAEATFTYVHFSYNLKPPGARDRIKLTFKGPGDTSLLLGRAFELGESESVRAPVEGMFDPTPEPEPERRRPLLGIWLGVSAPTGDPERPDPRIVTRDVSVTNLQTGTGTWDPQGRVRLEIPGGDVTWFTELGARVPVSENRYDYRTGAVYAAAAGLGVPVTSRLSGGFALTFQEVERDRFRGDDVAVGGGRWLYATPSVSYQVTDALAVDLSVRLTVWRDVDTKLSDSRYAAQIGLTWSF